MLGGEGVDVPGGFNVKMGSAGTLEVEDTNPLPICPFLSLWDHTTRHYIQDKKAEVNLLKRGGANLGVAISISDPNSCEAYSSYPWSKTKCRVLLILYF